MKKILKSLSYIIVSILVGVTVVYAGSTLSAPSAPTKTMHSLSDVYTLINTGNEANPISSIYQAPSEVGVTMNSLEEIYTKTKYEIALMKANNANKILEGNTFFGVTGTAISGSAPTVFASGDVTSYQCSWLDETGCSVNSNNESGCTWSGTACEGGEITASIMTPYEGAAACANSTEGSQTIGTWRLPTYGELVNYYVDNNQNGSAPQGFFQGGLYWSGTTYPNLTDNVYFVVMSEGIASFEGKTNSAYRVHCAR
jgi:hypothetical protein